MRRSDIQEVQVYDTNGNHLNSFGEGAFKGAIIKNMTATSSVNSRILTLEEKVIGNIVTIMFNCLVNRENIFQSSNVEIRSRLV